MVKTIFIFLLLIIFPFGQILKMGIVHPLDIVVGLGAIYGIYKKFKAPKYFVYIQNFLVIALFSWLFSIFFFSNVNVFYGFLYLLRLLAYAYFLIYMVNNLPNVKSKENILDSLLAISVVSAIFGWIQFFTIPDLKPFFEWGWDQHLFRLVGTFLDPTYLGLIIVFGLVISMNRIIEAKNKKWKLLLIGLFLLISLAFTYSRASYLAFIIGIASLLYFKKKILYILIPILILTGLIFILPTSKNHSISFFRTFSAIARVENYKDTLSIFSSYPVFGVGFNNICLAKQKLIGPEPFTSHACSGSDSSLLLVLATTGIIGFFVLIQSLYGVIKSLKYSNYYILYVSCLASLGIHSLFSNSMFYPWVIVYLVILLCLATQKGD